MIIQLKPDVTKEKALELATQIGAIHLIGNGRQTLVTSSKIKDINGVLDGLVEQTFVFDNDLQLAHASYKPEKRSAQIGSVTLGGNTQHTMMIAGPCSVESEEQIEASAKLMKSLGVKALRGGCFKPRTSPYSFQGLGLEGLKLLAKMREKYDLAIVTEVRDATHVDAVIKYADVVQIGAKAMYDHGVLRACGQAKKTVLLKRGFGTTLQEFVQAAEFVLSGGNEQVILCERGIRTFETQTRFTLDLCGVAFLKEKTNLPVVLDPSHAMGYAYGVPDITRACVAMGIDGLIIEVHPNPKIAKSDAAQQLNHDEFRLLHQTLPPIATAVGKIMV